MGRYQVAISFYVEEVAESLEDAEILALNKVRYKGLVHDIEAMGIPKEETDE